MSGKYMNDPERKSRKLIAVKKGFASFLHFITLGIWRIKLDDHPTHTSVLIRILRVIILSLDYSLSRLVTA